MCKTLKKHMRSLVNQKKCLRLIVDTYEICHLTKWTVKMDRSESENVKLSGAIFVVQVPFSDLYCSIIKASEKDTGRIYLFHKRVVHMRPG